MAPEPAPNIASPLRGKTVAAAVESRGGRGQKVQKGGRCPAACAVRRATLPGVGIGCVGRPDERITRSRKLDPKTAQRATADDLQAHASY